MRLATGDGIVISHPISKYEAWLTGKVDYGVIEYRLEYDNKSSSLSLTRISFISSNDIYSEASR
jgi:hypothetical protein